MDVDDVGHESTNAVAGAQPTMDLRGAQGVAVGNFNTLYIYNYRGTWTDAVAPSPLIDVRGDVESPYRGLGSFTECDAGLFFGRDAAIAAVLQRLSHCARQPSILMVSGVSGAGKSSLLRAGVLPRIRGGGLAGAPQAHTWPRLVLTPGHTPLDRLALGTAQLAGLDAATVRRELRADPAAFVLTASQAAQTPAGSPADGDHKRLLLVIDQFEQVFTQCPDPADRKAFVNALHAAATVDHTHSDVPAALVVLVVRADFEARCADYEHLGEAIQNRYLVTAMTERQLRSAITEPAKQAGHRVDDDLTEQLIREIRTRTYDPASTATSATLSSAGVLPLLSHALDQAWRIRAGDTLTVTDYERTGGIERAVADSAQRAYDGLTPSQQTVARQIFTRLTVPGSDGADTADRIHRHELTPTGTDTKDIDAVLEAFAAERLLTLGADTVEISHEALLTAWPLLRDTWLAETRADRAICARLHTAATEWARHSRDPSYLYSGSILDSATMTAARVTDNPARYAPLSDTDKQFLTAATRAQHARTRRRRALLSVLILLVVALTATTIIALRASQERAAQLRLQTGRILARESMRVADTDAGAALQFAQAAGRYAPDDPEVQAALLYQQVRTISEVSRKPVPWSQPRLAHANADGSLVAITEGDHDTTIWADLDSNPRLIWRLPPATSKVEDMGLSANGATFAAITTNGNVVVWNLRNRTGPKTVRSAQPDAMPGATKMAMSEDGRWLALSFDQHRAREPEPALTQTRPIGDPDLLELYDLSPTEPQRVTVTPPDDSVDQYPQYIDPDGTSIWFAERPAVGSTRRVVRDTASGRILRELPSGSLSRDGTIVDCVDGKRIVWDGKTGAKRFQWDLPKYAPCNFRESFDLSSRYLIMKNGIDGDSLDLINVLDLKTGKYYRHETRYIDRLNTLMRPTDRGPQITALTGSDLITFAPAAPIANPYEFNQSGGEVVWGRDPRVVVVVERNWPEPERLHVIELWPEQREVVNTTVERGPYAVDDSRVTRDGRLLVIAGIHGDVTIYALPELRIVGRFSLPIPHELEPRNDWESHASIIQSDGNEIGFLYAGLLTRWRLDDSQQIGTALPMWRNDTEIQAVARYAKAFPVPDHPNEFVMVTPDELVVRHVHDGHVIHSMHFEPYDLPQQSSFLNASTIYTVTKSGRTALLNLESGTISQAPQPMPHGDTVRMTPSGLLLAVSRMGDSVEVWDYARSTRLFAIKLPGSGLEGPAKLVGETLYVLRQSGLVTINLDRSDMMRRLCAISDRDYTQTERDTLPVGVDTTPPCRGK
ncbi:hypothetical protein ACIHDR_46875 [Nocardia sp. NPDC052278]|uniref:nSTAND1 domain-containing NTPase n=1 Tax=unclassified Nocardia TaxID=2637762 RepID=UPI0036AF89C8